MLDVKDDTPLPRVSPTSANFNRSILILTPERALKFTATSEVRHYIWLTALSFLSHPTQGIEDLAVPEPISQPEHRQHRPPLQEYAGNGVRRSQARDSIGLAKARSRPSIGAHSVSAPTVETERFSVSQLQMPWDDLLERPSEDAAEPPLVPRLTEHSRKRSGTGSRLPTGGLTGYQSHSGAVESKVSLHGAAAPHRNGFRSRDSSGNSTRRSTLTRSLVAENPPPMPPAPSVAAPVRNDFFDAVGTIRMEAFIDNGQGTGAAAATATAKTPSKPSKVRKKTSKTKEHKKDMRYWGVPEQPPGAAGASRWRRDDPFRGF